MTKTKKQLEAEIDSMLRTAYENGQADAKDEIHRLALQRDDARRERDSLRKELEDKRLEVLILNSRCDNQSEDVKSALRDSARFKEQREALLDALVRAEAELHKSTERERAWQQAAQKEAARNDTLSLAS